MPEYHVVSVSHIDMAFVMRKEAYAEMAEILLERIISVLERNPEIHFALEQVAHYRNLKQRRPELFDKVKELLKTGRLEFMGGMATTMETNFPNGECFVRNQGLGLRWLEEHLEVQPHSGWLVDTFGLNTQIPQLMEQFGFRYLHANRFGGNKTVDLFQAEGLNGSRVVVIGCDSNSINVLPETQSMIFCRSWADVDTLFRKADRLRGELPKLVTYYIENEEVYSEYYLKLTRERQNNGDWRHSTYKEFTDALENSGYTPPVLKEDLNPEFTGTYALRSSIKTENRKTETTLLNAELWHTLLSGEEEDPFEDDWWELFHCQFHDAFTGSHEDITHEDLLDRFRRIREHCSWVQRRSLGLSETETGLVCCNSLPWDRSAWIRVDGAASEMVVWDGDHPLPTVRDGQRLWFYSPLKAGSIHSFTLRPGEADAACTRKGDHQIRNEYLTLTLDDRFGLARLEDREGNCYLQGAGGFLTAEEDQGGMQIEQCTGRAIYASSGTITLEEACTDAMGEHIAMYGTFPAMPWNRENRLSWRMELSLRRGEPMLRMKLVLDWSGDRTRIRLRLPASFPGRDFWNEVPFGVIRREPYQDRPTAKGEWPVQRFAALEDGHQGFALLNRGIAGVQIDGRTLATTLIRAYGEGPDAWVAPTQTTNQWGRSEFEFAAAAYRGGWRENEIVRLAQEFNQEPVTTAGTGDSTVCGRSWYRLEGQGIALSTIKSAWDGSGDVIVRLYETLGQHASGSFYLKGAASGRVCDLREQPLKTLPVIDSRLEISLKPFEILTVRIARN